MSKKIKIIVEERIVERSTCFNSIYSFIYDLCVKSFGTESFVARPENMYVSIIDEEKTLMERFDEKKQDIFR